MLASLAELAQEIAQLALSLKETSILSMLIHVSTVELAKAAAQ